MIAAGKWLNVVVLVLLQSKFCHSWGNLGHRTVALLAEKYLTPAGRSYSGYLLGAEDISDASIWADIYKTTPEGRYTSSWHFIDARDDPPSSCNVSVERDCSPSRTCITAALSNMTQQLQYAGMSWESYNKAFKFLLHLIGDLHNPLHAESISRGGNDIPVFFHGQNVSLHFLWDVSILQERTQSNETNEKAAAQAWADRLFKSSLTVDLSSGSVGVQGQSFQLGFDLDQHETWALAWARESNGWICSYVLRDGVENIKSKELSGEYYHGAVPIIEDLLEKAGMRLALWINEVATMNRY